MAVLSVRKYGDPALRRKALPVAEITREIRELASDMVDTLYAENGIGLAAPQVGIAVRLLLIAEADGTAPEALVNPEIMARGGEATAEEGCLSLPGVYAEVTRSAWVEVRATNLDGRTRDLRAAGLRARVIQHELDHLDGMLFIDRLEPMARDRIKRQIRKHGFPEETARLAPAL